MFLIKNNANIEKIEKKKGIPMSLSFWLILTAVIGICVFIFTKTVSSDAKNDYKIRDILANTKSELRKEEQEEPEEEPVPVATVPKQSFEEYQNEHNVYEELVAKQREKGVHLVRLINIF